MSERKERCETCRWWDVWDDREPPTKPFCEVVMGTRETVLFAGLDPDKPTVNTDRRGWCYRNPPQCVPEAEKDDQLMGHWPHTCTADFCGEWTPNP